MTFGTSLRYNQKAIEGRGTLGPSPLVQSFLEFGFRDAKTQFPLESQRLQHNRRQTAGIFVRRIPSRSTHASFPNPTIQAANQPV